jgi:hypothetical protein
MKTKVSYRWLRGGVAFALLVALTACGGPPAWVKKGSAAYNEKDSKIVYGVGSVVGVRNEPLAWDAAENMARAEITKRFQTYTAYLMRNYAASTTAGDFQKSSEEQNVERAVKTFSSGTLTGVMPVDRYKDEDSQTYYVLVKMDFKAMQEALAQSKELSPQVRDYVRQNGEKLFEKLEKEETKRDGK